MCTVTVWRDPTRVQVTMNRDERWGRAPELPPRTRSGGPTGTAWTAPADGERGGTWMGVNEHGMVACLLNGYTAADLPLLSRDDVPSRGAIVPEVLSRTPDDAWRWLDAGLDPEPYPSFTLLVVSVTDAAELCWRRGDRLRRRPVASGWTMVSSSFWRPEDVLAWRRERFETWRDAGGSRSHGVPAYNLLEEPGRREWSPFMTRAISATRSVTDAHVDLESGRASLRWWPRTGDQVINPSRPGGALELPLSATAMDRS
jgi:hypothetical protein